MNSEPPTANGTAMQANKTSVESKLNNGKKALLAMVNMGENSNIGRVLVSAHAHCGAPCVLSVQCGVPSFAYAVVYYRSVAVFGRVGNRNTGI